MNQVLYAGVLDAIHWMEERLPEHTELLPILARLRDGERAERTTPQSTLSAVTHYTTNTSPLFRVLRTWNHALVADLEQCLTQKICTTKHERRERALAYLMDALTGAAVSCPTAEFREQLLLLLADLAGKASSEEAKVSLSRAAKRVGYMVVSSLRECVACGEHYTGQGHHCTNKAATAKDAAHKRAED